MSPKMLAVTRTLVGAAVAITGFIIRNADKIEAAAKVIHAWALTTSVKLAERKVDAAYDRYLAANNAIKVARDHARIAFDQFEAVAKTRDVIEVAVVEELATL